MHAPRDDLVVAVERELAVLVEQQLEQRLHVAGVELRGVLGHLGGQVERRDDRHVVHDGRPRPALVSSQLPPVSPARSMITLPGLIPSTASAVTSLRRRAPGDQRRRDHDVEALDRVGQRLLLGSLLLVGQLARVAALAGGLDPEVEPRRAERTDLLGDLGPHVVAGRLRAEPPRRRERLQARRRRAPSTSTFAGGIVPAAVISIGKKRPMCSAPSSAAR